MKFITLNLRSDADRWIERFPLIVDILNAEQADFIALQEVRLSIHQAHLIADALNALRSELPYTVVLCEDTYSPQFLANAFLSRWPVCEVARLPLNEGYRTAQRVRVLLGECYLDLVNTHLHHKPARDEVIRYSQMEQILDWLKVSQGLQHATILAGDMNARPQSETIELARRFFRSAHYSVHGREPESSFPTPLRSDCQIAPRLIDYIFYSPDLLYPLDAKRIADQPHPQDQTLFASDHYGLSAVFQMKA